MNTWLGISSDSPNRRKFAFFFFYFENSLTFCSRGGYSNGGSNGYSNGYGGGGYGGGGYGGGYGGRGGGAGAGAGGDRMSNLGSSLRRQDFGELRNNDTSTAVRWSLLTDFQI